MYGVDSSSTLTVSDRRLGSEIEHHRITRTVRAGLWRHYLCLACGCQASIYARRRSLGVTHCNRITSIHGRFESPECLVITLHIPSKADDTRDPSADAPRRFAGVAERDGHGAARHARPTSQSGREGEQINDGCRRIGEGRGRAIGPGHQPSSTSTAARFQSDDGRCKALTHEPARLRHASLVREGSPR